MSFFDRIMNRFEPSTAMKDPEDSTLPRVPLSGLAGCGKTMFAAGWLLNSQDKANYGKDIFNDVDEGQSDIRLSVDLLKSGHFAPKTPLGTAYQAILYWKRRQLYGLKWDEICSPVIDPSGEEWKALIDQYAKKMYERTAKVKKDLTWLQKYVIDCDAVILIMDSTKAKGVFKEGYEDVRNNPDTESARILEAMLNYKADPANHARPLKGVLLAMTKYDAIRDYLPHDLRLENEDSRMDFLKRCFNHTWSKINYRRIPNVLVLPFWFAVEKDENDKVVQWDDGSPKISINEVTGRPYMSDGSFDLATEWMWKLAG